MRKGILSTITLLVICCQPLLLAVEKPFSVTDALALGEKEYQSCSGSHWKSNPDMPPRNSEGRINAKIFFEKYANKKLEITEDGIVPDGNFGEFKPGDQFGNSWLVRAVGMPVGVSHKTAPWVTAYIECKSADGSVETTQIAPDRGCGCGGTSDWTWTIPFSAPAGKHKLIVSWEWPTKTDQILRREYDVSIVNDLGPIAADADLALLEKEHGKNNVIVLQNGSMVNGRPYSGVDDMCLSCGGYEGDRSGIINSASNIVDIGYWIVNQKASFYARGLFRFDLEALNGKKVKYAVLKLSIKQNQKYLPPVLKQSMPVFAMKKTWKESQENKKIFIDKRGLGVGYPNVYYQSYPTMWQAQLASGDEDRTEQIGEVVIDPHQLQIPGACAEVTAQVNAWLSGAAENHGFLIGADLPTALNGVHPGLDGKSEDFKQLYNGGAVPFISSDEATDIAFSPRLIIVLE